MEIRLAPEYECQPTWIIDGDMIDTIDPSELPIPAALAEQIKAWGARYEATYNRDDPGSSGFSSPIEQAEFAQEGRRLWQALRDALGPEYEVTYSSILTEWESRGKRNPGKA